MVMYVASFLILGLLGVFSSCTYAGLMSCASCVSKNADNIDYFPGETGAEGCMSLRMEDYVVPQSLRGSRTAQARAA
jgi:hypothetical protein